MNSAEIFLKISNNILETISSFEKNEQDKFEFNNNLFLNLSFLTKFTAGKNIQDNPAFSFFIPKKNNLLNSKIAKNLQNENINFDSEKNRNFDYNLQTKDNEGFQPQNTENNLIKGQNVDLDQTNIENITGKIEDEFRLETRHSMSILNENLDETINLNRTTHNIMKDMADFDAKSKLMMQENRGNHKNMTDFDLEQSYVEGMSSIYHNDNFSEFIRDRDQSVFDPNLSVIIKKGSVENHRFSANAHNLNNAQESPNKQHKSSYK